MNKIRIGIIGIGAMGKNYVNKFSEGLIPNMELVAVCDIIDEKLKYADRKMKKNLTHFNDAEEMISSGVVDAVMIVTPHYFHTKLGIKALENGLHVMVDKPTGVYTKEVKTLNDAAKKSDKTFGTMFCLRTMAVYKKIKEMVENGELGEIKRICWIATDWYRPDAYHKSSSWRSSWSTEGGGMLINQCPHNLDLWQWMFGMPKSVTAHIPFGRYYDIEVDDDVTAYMEYENGLHGTFIAATGETPGSNRLEISADMGKLLLENGKLVFYKNVVSEREFNKTNTVPMAKPDVEIIEIELATDDDIHASVLNNFADVIINGGELVSPGIDGIKELELSNAMYMSAWEDTKVTLPIDEDKYLKLLEKRGWKK